jgi:DHA1 family tetracycline resistance protein-like MFS transporter
MAETAPAGRRKASLGFIYVAVLVDYLSLGIIIPVFPILLKTLTGQGDAGAAQIAGIFAATWALMQLIFAPIFGNLSDRIGRRPVLLVSMFGTSLDFVIMALAPTIAWLFVGRVISGVTSASESAASAYVADVSTPETRARNFGRFQASGTAGILLGPALGGLLGSWNPHAPFWAAAALALANGLYGLFVLPESLAVERRTPFRWSRANPVGAVALLMSRPGLAGLAAVAFLFQFASMSFNSIFQFFTHYRFGWGPAGIAVFLVALSGGSMIVESFAAGAVAAWIGERRAVIAGVALGAAGFLGLGLAPTEPWFWAATAVVIMAGVASPSLMSMLSAHVGESEQGQLQGALSLLFGLAALVAPIAFTNLFAWAIGPGRGLGLPGLPVLVGAALTAGGLELALLYARPPQAVAIIAPESSAD